MGSAPEASTTRERRMSKKSAFTADAGGVSQSYGQLVRLGVIANFFGASPKTFNPGDTCRGGSNVPE
jgi:hypothetical protein